MPKIQTYQSRIRPGLAPDLGRVPTFEPAVQAFSQTGQILQKRGLQMLEEHDSAVAMDAFNRVREGARGKLSELGTRLGGDAVGLQDEYTQWYRKEEDRQNENMTVARQRELFSELSTRQFQHNLDTLARHEAKQAQQHKIDAFGTNVEETIEAVRTEYAVDAPIDDQFINSQIEMINASSEKFFKGLDRTEQKKQIEQQIRHIALVSMLEKDPQAALKKLKEWRIALGPKYDQIKEEVQEEALYDFVSGKFPGDYDKQEDYVSQAKYSQSVKKSVLSTIGSYQAESRSRENEARIERRESGFNLFWSQMRAKNFGEARKTATGLDIEDFSEAEKYALEQKALVVEPPFKGDKFEYTNLRMKILKGDIDDVQQLYTPETINRLENTQIEKLEKLIGDRQKDPAHYGAIITDLEQQFDRTFKEDVDMFSNKIWFTEELYNDVEKAEREKGRRLNRQEVYDIGNNLLKTRYERGFLDFGEPSKETTEIRQRFEARAEGEAAEARSPSPTMSTPVQQIPENIRNDIYTSLKAGGKDATHANIWAIFEKHYPDEAAGILNPEQKAESDFAQPYVDNLFKVRGKIPAGQAQ